MFMKFLGAWGLTLESPDSFSGPESYFVFAVFTFKIKGFNSLDNETISK